MKRRSVFLIALFTGAALTMAACGSTGTSETSAASAETSVSSEAQEASSASAETEEASAEAETSAEAESSSGAESVSYTKLTEDDITVNETYEDSGDGTHAIEADGETAEYSNIKVVKTGDSDGEEADFYGENAAVFATNGANLTISDAVIQTDGTHANGVFSYAEGTTVTISDSLIETTSNNSGGLMVTGGGTLIANNLTIHTTGNSSAAIRSDRGGGTETVTGGYYQTDGTGSPVIYSTADVTVSDAYMESTASQAVVVEGQNSVTLNNCEVVADNNTKNSDNSDTYQAVMIYQSMSGDADEGTASFSMTDGSLTNANGDVFFVNNTVADISLSGVEIVNDDEEGVFLRAEAAGWGTEGSNGGHINLYAAGQTIDGDMIVDSVSELNLYLSDASAFEGAINSDGAAGDVYVEIDEDSTWTLTADSYVTSLTCDADAIDLNGYTLYVDGEVYTEGTASEGEAITFEVSSGNGGDMGEAPDGQGAPDGEAPDGEAPDGEAPDGEGGPGGEAPDGQGGPGGDGSTPPAKPGE